MCAKQIYEDPVTYHFYFYLIILFISPEYIDQDGGYLKMLPNYNQKI